MNPHNHALFQVANKALLFKNDLLLVLTTPRGNTDFPGGRVDETEIDLPWSVALQRELHEELGAQIHIGVGAVAFVTKRIDHKTGQTIATIFYACTYESGDIEISEEHTAFDWIKPADLFATPRKFISEDEKVSLQQYFADKV